MAIEAQELAGKLRLQWHSHLYLNLSVPAAPAFDTDSEVMDHLLAVRIPPLLASCPVVVLLPSFPVLFSPILPHMVLHFPQVSVLRSHSLRFHPVPFQIEFTRCAFQRPSSAPSKPPLRIIW